MSTLGLGTNTANSEWAIPSSCVQVVSAVEPHCGCVQDGSVVDARFIVIGTSSGDTLRAVFALFVVLGIHAWILASSPVIELRVPTETTDGTVLSVTLVSQPARVEQEQIEVPEEPVVAETAEPLPEVVKKAEEPTVETVAEPVLPEPQPVPVEPVRPVKPKPVERKKQRVVKPKTKPVPKPDRKVVEEKPKKQSKPKASSATVQVYSDKPKLVLEPKYRKPPPPPHYPRRARRLGQQGTVILQALVDELGATRTVKIVKSSGFDLLDKAAHRSVSLWEFIPANEAGRNVQSWVQVPVTFRLR